MAEQLCELRKKSGGGGGSVVDISKFKIVDSKSCAKNVATTFDIDGDGTYFLIAGLNQTAIGEYLFMDTAGYFSLNVMFNVSGNTVTKLANSYAGYDNILSKSGNTISYKQSWQNTTTLYMVKLL